MRIICVYEKEPNFPAADQHPDATRSVIFGHIVDAIGEPTDADVQEFLGLGREYILLRQAAYPPIVDQLDTIFHGGLDAWKAEIQVTKNKYPKEVA